MDAKTKVPLLQENIDKEARIMTDEAGQYNYLKDDFADHKVVIHSNGEYVSKEDRTVHTNTAEGYFRIFKLGMKGVYQHCKKQHLHRYLAVFDFRYNNRCSGPKTKKRPARQGVDDVQRAEKLLKGVVGRRLTCQTTCWQEGGVMT